MLVCAPVVRSSLRSPRVFWNFRDFLLPPPGLSRGILYLSTRQDSLSSVVVAVLPENSPLRRNPGKFASTLQQWVLVTFCLPGSLSDHLSVTSEESVIPSIVLENFQFMLLLTRRRKRSDCSVVDNCLLWSRTCLQVLGSNPYFAFFFSLHFSFLFLTLILPFLFVCRVISGYVANTQKIPPIK